MSKELTIVSTFDGMSCIQIALQKIGITKYNIYCSEIDKHAINVCKSNFPNTVQVGDVTKLSYRDGILQSENGTFNIGKVDLFVGGSPCQSLSGLGDGSGLEGKSGLFFHWLRLRGELLNYNKDCNWLLENVVPKKKEWVGVLNDLVGSEGKLFDAKLFVPITRPRLFWTNWEFYLPTPSPIRVDDVLLDNSETEHNKLTHGRYNWITKGKGISTCKKGFARIVHQDNNVKGFQCLTARSEGSWNSNYVLRSDGSTTKLSINEYECLQGVPLDFTASARLTERYKMLGNGWNIYVITNILSNLYLK